MAQNNVNGFTANAGQMKDTDGSLRSDLLYTANAAGAKIYLRQTGISFCWYQAAADSLKKDSAYRMDVDFVNASSNLLVTPSALQSSYSNYFIGNVSSSNVSEYGKVIYQNLWPNIDLTLSIDSSGFTYKYHLKKGANPNDIKIVYNGGKSFQTGSKSMSITIPFGKSISFLNPSIKSLGATKNKPVITSSLNSSKVNSFSFSNLNVNAEYEVVQVASAAAPCNPCPPNPNPGPYTANKWTTYYGANYFDIANDVFIDINSNIYVIGTTNSFDFPFDANAIMPSPQGGDDAFVVKFNRNREKVFATYYGGNNTDEGVGITVGNTGLIYIIGNTYSTNILAVGAGYAKPTRAPHSGDRQGFIARISTNGNSLEWSTYFSSFNDLTLSDVCIDGNNLCIVGNLQNPTQQYSIDLKTFAGGYNQNASQTSLVSCSFITKFSLATNQLVWSSYLGSTSHGTQLMSCSADANGNLVVGGLTYASGSLGCNLVATTTLPICKPLSNSYSQLANSGQKDLYIARFSNSNAITYATLYGGSNNEETYANSIDLGANGDIYVTGSTYSTNLPGPNLYSTAQLNNGGSLDAFVLRFNSQGVRSFASYLGGQYLDFGKGIKSMPPYGYAVIGQTNSDNFPTQQRPNSYFDGQVNNNLFGTSDGFYTEYSSVNQRIHSTFIGGSGFDQVRAIGTYKDLQIVDDIVLVGSTEGLLNFPLNDILPGTNDYFQGSINGGVDAFIMNLKYNCGNTCRSILSNYQPEFDVYPNPSNGIVSIKSTIEEKFLSISVYNAVGKMVHNKTMVTPENELNLDLSENAAGIYFLRIITEQGLLRTKKIILN